MWSAIANWLYSKGLSWPQRWKHEILPIRSPETISVRFWWPALAYQSQQGYHFCNKMNFLTLTRIIISLPKSGCALHWSYRTWSGLQIHSSPPTDGTAKSPPGWFGHGWFRHSFFWSVIDNDLSCFGQAEVSSEMVKAIHPTFACIVHYLTFVDICGEQHK